MRDVAYLQLLAREFPSVKEATGEIVNLMAICSLPKGTEYFFSDLHGEYEAFIHLLRSSSGIIREKIKETFGYVIPEEEQLQLANLIYYPERHLPRMMKQGRYTEDWQRITIYRLIQICREVASKYTRSKVRKKMPKEYAYTIDELLHVDGNDENKKLYYNEIIHSIIDTSIADKFIAALCRLIQNLTIDNLHIIGDIFDRGPRADIIMQELMSFHDVDIQWGNHDISWMGAAAGNLACICNVLRIAISYNSFDVLEDGYGINLRPLSMFAAKVYQDDPCVQFMPKILDENIYDAVDPGLAAKMHKAIAVIQFKLEGKLVRRHKEFQMEDRALLHRINPEKGTITLPDGKEYPLRDNNFPTIDWKHPYELTAGEKEVMDKLSSAFRNCEKLQNHIRLLLDKGGLYTVYNGNLLFHGSIPLNEDGTFREVQIYGKSYKGKELYDVLETYVRRAFYSVGKEEQKKGRDIMWYIWAAPNSPLFGKSKMSTFERYFIEDPSTHEEKKNAYYRLWENEEVVDNMLREFGLDPEKGHIINGHVPVHQSEGESPVKCDGKVIVIDGGFSKPYQKVTGIAGYTLIYNSYGLNLTAHEPFTSKADAVARETDIVSNRVAVSYMSRRQLVGDTDTGHALKERIQELIQLLDAYRTGIIKEKK